jgi:Questin oxidase-like
MARPLRMDRPGVVGEDPELEKWLIEGRRFSAEFPAFLANHLPMALVALRSLGASDRRLGEYFEWYRETNHLVLAPPRAAPIERVHWTAALGERSRESDYRDFFHREVETLGARAAIGAYLPVLLPGLAASATHGFMRLAYGVMRQDDAEIATALGYWAATYLELGKASGAKPSTDNPAEVLLRMRSVASFRHVETELDLLWHFMRGIAAKPEFAGIVDALNIGPGTFQRAREASLALFAGTLDFCALHALTGCHWLRLLQPVNPDPDSALRYFWQAIAALYPKIGFPDLPNASALDEWRRLPCPDWPEIEVAAVRSNDEHDLSLTFSAREEWRAYGDRLYQVVAARRLGLIA